MIRFDKATPANGVDGHITPDHPEVVVAPSELPAPLFPEQPGFWNQFDAAVTCMAVMRGGAERLNHTTILSPAFRQLGANTLAAGAELIRAEPATLLPTEAWRRVESPWRVIPGLDGNFINRHILIEDLVGWAARKTGPSCFAAKWHFMVPRPEEVAFAVLNGDVDAPWWSRCALDAAFPDPGVILQDRRRFTRYPEGCPGHPAYPAMHAACAGAQLAVIEAMFELTAQDAHNVRWAVHNKAYFRTWAGVHYPMDNLAGLWIGWETVRRSLPAKLVEYGADPAAVAGLVPPMPAPVF